MKAIEFKESLPFKGKEGYCLRFGTGKMLELHPHRSTQVKKRGVLSHSAWPNGKWKRACFAKDISSRFWLPFSAFLHTQTHSPPHSSLTMMVTSSTIRPSEHFITLFTLPKLPHWHNIGNIYLAQGNLEGAIREYQASIRLAPDYDESHNNLGIAYEMSCQFEAAITEYKKAISLNPENVNARNNLANAMREGVSPSKK